MRAKRTRRFSRVCYSNEGRPPFHANERTHPAFSQALREACLAGVRVLAVDCAVAPGEMRIRDRVEVRL